MTGSPKEGELLTLALVQGDLVLSAGSFTTLTGVDKIRQDLDVALHEEYGGDVYHPYWGTILDRYIGQPLTPAAQISVTTEVQRVLKNYIATQADLLSVSSTNNTKSIYDTNDIVMAVESIDAQVSFDRITVTVVLQTMSHETITITRQVLA